MSRTIVLHVGWMGLLLAALGGCAPTSFLITPVSPNRELTEQVVLRESFWATRKIALIDVDGVLSNARPRSMLGGEGENPVSVFAEKLQQARDDQAVKAVVLRINSPGGGVTASDLMYTEVRRFKAETGKPVAVAMLDLAASGGYYIACAGDRIYAQPTTVTGSIGVIMMAPEFAGTMRKIGAEVNIIKSGELKDMGSPFRGMNEKDREVFQGLIDRMYARFFDVVQQARHIEPDKLRSIADGRVYLAPEAKELHLVDEIGTLQDALVGAKKLAGLEDTPVQVVQYTRPYGYRPTIYAGGEVPAAAQVNLVNVELPRWLTASGPQFMYLWAPTMR
jgi:protease-4